MIIWKGMGSMELNRPRDSPTATVFMHGLQSARLKSLKTILFSHVILRIRGCLSVRYDFRTSLE